MIVNRLRTASTARLVTVASVFVIALIAAVAAIAAVRDSGPTPQPEPLANAIHDALSANAPTGVTARIDFTNNLFPSGALTGQTGSALLSGANGRLWVNPNGGRLELQSDAGDVQIVWNDSKITVYDASSNTAYVADLPKDTSSSSTTHTTPTLDQITSFLTDAGKYWSISGAQPSNVAGEPAYTVTASPSSNGGLVGSAELAWDAVQGVPLKLAVYAKGASSPALALTVTDISFGSVADSDVQVSPPAGAKIVDLSQNQSSDSGSGTAPVTGLSAVEAAAPFTVVAPSSLNGDSLSDIRLVNGKTVIAVYGEGLGSTVLIERAQDTSGGSGTLSQLPTVSINGATANELATELGTVLTWSNNGVTYVLAASAPSAAVEAAARSLP
jgi:outer membrane lipoprotein-sorting protein